MNSTSGPGDAHPAHSSGPVSRTPQQGPQETSGQGRQILGINGKPLNLSHMGQKADKLAPKIREQVERFQGAPPQARLRANPNAARFYNERMKGQKAAPKRPLPAPPKQEKTESKKAEAPKQDRAKARPSGGHKSDPRYGAIRGSRSSKFQGMNVDQRIQNLEQRKDDIQARLGRIGDAAKQGKIPAEKHAQVKRIVRELLDMSDRNEIALDKAYAEREAASQGSGREDTDTQSPSRLSMNSDVSEDISGSVVEGEAQEVAQLEKHLQSLQKLEQGDHSRDAERQDVQARLAELKGEPAGQAAGLRRVEVDPNHESHTANRVGIVANAARRGQALPTPALRRQATHTQFGTVRAKELTAQDYQRASKQSASLYSLASAGDRAKEIKEHRAGEAATPRAMKLKTRRDGSITAVESSNTKKMGRNHKRSIVAAYKDVIALMKSPVLEDKQFAMGLVARLIRPSTIEAEAKKLMSEQELEDCQGTTREYVQHLVQKSSPDALKLQLFRAIEAKMQRYAITERGGSIHDNRRELAAALNLLPGKLENAKQGELDEAIKEAVSGESVESLIDQLAGQRKGDIRLAGLLIEAAAGVEAQSADIRINIERMAQLQDQLARLQEPAVREWLGIDAQELDACLKVVADAEAASSRCAAYPLNKDAQQAYREALLAASKSAQALIENVHTETRKQTASKLVHVEQGRDSLEQAWNSYILENSVDREQVQSIIAGRQAIEHAGRYGEAILSNMSYVQAFVGVVCDYVHEHGQTDPAKFASLRQEVGAPIAEKAEKRRFNLAGELMPYQPKYREDAFKESELDGLIPSSLNTEGRQQMRQWTRMGIRRPPAGPERLKAGLRKQVQYIAFDRLPFEPGKIPGAGGGDRLFDVDALSKGKYDIRQMAGDANQQKLDTLGLDSNSLQFMVYFGSLCDYNPEAIVEHISQLSDEEVQAAGAAIAGLDESLSVLIEDALVQDLGEEFMLVWGLADQGKLADDGYRLGPAALERLEAVKADQLFDTALQRLHSVSQDELASLQAQGQQRRDRVDAAVSEARGLNPEQETQELLASVAAQFSK